jgi:octopine/nopaline transport system permease protein
MDFAFLESTFLLLLTGVPLTAQLMFVSIVCGAVIATGIALLRLSRVAVLDAIARGYVFLIRGTPLLIQIFLIYYGLGQFRPTLQAWGLWGVFREPYWCAIFALTLNTAAYGSEIIRGGLQSVPHHAIEAGRAVGMSTVLLARRIIFPIALRQALPAYSNEIILVLKATSLVSSITMMEVTGLAAKLMADTFRSVEIFFVAGAIYLGLNSLIAAMFAIVEWWVSPHTRGPKQAKSQTLPTHA